MMITWSEIRARMAVIGVTLAVLILGSFRVEAADANPKKGNGQVLLGAPDFYPSSEHPVGWRGDGTGHFPGANPPLIWSYAQGGGTNIVWQSRMPFDSPSSVIVVGEKLFTTGNDYALICADKRTGKILWVRPVSPFDAATTEDRDAHKDIFDKLDSLAQKRDELLARIPGMAASVSNELSKVGAEISKNDEEMMKLLSGADRAKYRSTGMGEGGYMATTPASDGACVYAWNGWGVTACFDLDGNRKWIRFDQLQPQEHGHYSSPLLVGDLVIVYVGRQYLALDKRTGKEVWRTDHKAGPGEAGWWFASHVGTSIGGENVLVAGDGSLIRALDGTRIAKGTLWHTGKGSSVVGGGFAFWMEGSGGVNPKANGSPVRYYQLPERVDVPFTPVIKGSALEPPEGGRHVVPSVLYHDGLLYVVGNNPIFTSSGKPGLGPAMLLFVCDVLTEKIVYTRPLDFGVEPSRSDRPYGSGMAASPAMAGGKVFLIGNFGTTLILNPGREYKEAGRNVIDQRISYQYRDDRLEGTVSSPFFEGNRIYYRAQRYLYCIGEPVKP